MQEKKINKISVSLKKEKKAPPTVELRHCMVTIHLFLPTTGMVTRMAFTAGKRTVRTHGLGRWREGPRARPRLAVTTRMAPLHSDVTRPFDRLTLWLPIQLQA